MSKIVHALRGGITFCDRQGLPKEWPKDEVWVRWDEPGITCPECLANLGHGDFGSLLTNVVSYDEQNTECITNYKEAYQENPFGKLDSPFGMMGDWYRKYHDRWDNVITGSTKVAQEVFGRQQTTKNYSYRNWIWTFSTPDERNTIHLLVSQRGWHWEFNTNSEKEIIGRMWITLLKEVVS